MVTEQATQGHGQWRRHVHAPRSFGERAVDAVAATVGSWTFIIVQSVVVILWLMLNIVGFIAHWDPYPFILLNLLFSTQAAYTAPIIMMSQNRQAAKDRLRDDREADEVSLLFTVNQQQLQILQLLKRQLCIEEAEAEATTVPAASAPASAPAAPPPDARSPSRRSVARHSNPRL